VVRGVLSALVGVDGGRCSERGLLGRYVHRPDASGSTNSLVGFGPAAYSPTLRR
jgi:hypothetical protein